MTDLRSLRHFVTVARRLNFSRAAEELGLSQSALTRSIQALEKRMGMRLLDRNRKGAFLTPQGELVFSKAANLLEATQAFEGEVSAAARGDRGRVRFGMGPMPARALLATALLEQLRLTPNLGTTVMVRSPAVLWPLLASGEIEFFIAGEGLFPDKLPVRTEVMGKFPITLMVRAGHPLLTEGDSGTEFPILMSNKFGESLEPHLHYREKIWGTVHIIEDFSTIVALTRNTDAILINSAFAVLEDLRDGSLCELRLPVFEEQRTYRVIAYSLGDRTQSPASLSIIRLLRQEIRRLELNEAHHRSLFL